MESFRYPHLMKPVRIGGLTLKNRMIATCCLPHFLQGPENYPSESIIAFVEGIAKAGAAIVTVPDRFDNTRILPMEDVKRAPCWDPGDPSVDNYLSQMSDAVHFQSSYITAQLSKFHSIPRDVDVYAHEEVPGPRMMTGLEPPPPPVPFKEITRAQMELLAQEIVSRAAYYKSVGFDGIVLHCAYAYNVLAKFLPASTNLRTDEFGGPVENRARFPLSVARRVKEACGTAFYVEMQISGDCMPPEELARFARLCEGVVDVLQLRRMDMDDSHVSNFSYDGVSVPKTAAFAEIIKRSGAHVMTAPNGGFHDPDRNERLIAEGKTDLVALARPFIADPEYGRKLLEERPEDIVPCLYCNKCHDHVPGLWLSACRVNPVMGIAHRLKAMTDTETGQKKSVCVLGGGPAGLYAALLAADRGHRVTLYEKTGKLGGQLLHADYASFGWALKNYKDYLIAQVEKRANVRVIMNCAPTPEQVSAEGFDAVIAACGADAAVPPIPGTESTPFLTPPETFSAEDALGKRVIVIGGGETGAETGMVLAEAGHEVTVLTRGGCLAPNAWSVHAYSLMKRRWESIPGFSFLPDTAVLSVAPGQVEIERNGARQILSCNGIVIAGGVRGRTDEALRYADCARQFFLIGDCDRPENIQHCTRSALAAVSKL